MFLLGSLLLTFVLASGTVNAWEGFLFVGLYILYVTFVIVQNYWRPKPKAKAQHQPSETSPLLGDSPIAGSVNSPSALTGPSMDPLTASILGLAPPSTAAAAVGVDAVEVDVDSLPSTQTAATQTPLRGLAREVEAIGWDDKSGIEKVIYVLESPFTLARNLTILPISNDMFSPFFACVGCVLTPLWFIYGAGLFTPGAWPLIMAGAVIGLVAALLLYKATLRHSFPHGPMPPALLLVLGVLGFASCIVWLAVIASEVVSLLRSLGVICRMSETLIGLTLLSWANSIGDLVADIAVARNGHPEMATAAIFAAPLQNMLIGLGIPFIAICLETGPWEVQMDRSTAVSLVILLVGLVGHLIVIPACGFRSPRWWGIVTVCYYFVGLVIDILVVEGVV
eukprot:gnl/Ergobibamus_cyprinoides/500.p1 GENE.gnl/Ergobibamus_cyprinoides/500~~gnl/Ergobibamus_cyprinoides/500.p1  ORF type:complete len:422 (+),score=167.51 gnl/Ergobibamus_cyprinoides/500:83-1267(+)